MVNRVMAPRFSDELSSEERVVDKFERCRDLHHGVYDCMASLTKLQHLDLGFEDWDLYVSKYNYTYYMDEKRYFEYGGPPLIPWSCLLRQGWIDWERSRI